MKQRTLRPQVEEEARTRYEAAGPSAVMTDELLAALIGDGTAEAPAVIRAMKGSARRVLDAEPAELTAAGAGPELVFRAAAVREIIRRYASERVEARPFVRSSSEGAEYFRAQVSGQKVESFRCAFLDAKNTLIEEREMIRGTVDSSAVYPREIIKAALDLQAAAVVFCHNHPSGDPEPSSCDREITRELVLACRVMQIKALDHLVIGENGKYFSFADHGLIRDFELLAAGLAR
jgi:DNA repair protein RadC